MGRHFDSARERIIDVAEQVVIELGAGHLTFDTVSARSGVSRGGLLYHFPDKKALLMAMLDRNIERSTESRKKKRDRLPEGMGREIVAHVLSALDIGTRSRRITAAAFFALAAHDPGLLVPLKQRYRKLLDELTGDGLRFERAAVIALATDGLRLLEVLSMSPFDMEQRGRIVGELMALAKENRRGGR